MVLSARCSGEYRRIYSRWDSFYAPGAGWTRKWPYRQFFYTVLAGGFLGLLIEVLQAYIPQRDSGWTDVITNTLGTAIGALIARPSLVRSIFGKS